MGMTVLIILRNLMQDIGKTAVFWSREFLGLVSTGEKSSLFGLFLA